MTGWFLLFLLELFTYCLRCHLLNKAAAYTNQALRNSYLMERGYLKVCVFVEMWVIMFYNV